MSQHDALPGSDAAGAPRSARGARALPIADALPIDDALPGSDDALPGSDDALPGSDDALPGSDDALPGSDDALPIADGGEPAVEAGTAADDGRTDPESTALTRIVVAIDGPSGSGKSSTARGVARRLGLRYLDTGAMYRAVTHWLLAHGVDVADPAAVAAHVDQPRLQVGTDPNASTITVDGADVSTSIRGHAVTAAVSAVSAVPEVRSRMVAAQRALIGAGGVVVEGRDIGTAVAPGAEVKVYLVASEGARAVRRHAELGGAAVPTVDDTGAALRRRDRLDSTRTASPLACADDAVVIDSTDHSLDDVISLVVDLVARATRPSGPVR